MHIEPGFVSTAKIAAANVAATGLLVSHALPLLRQPQLILRTLLAALFFSVFMQSFHLAVGPSELHFIGAMPMYLILGFVPTLLGFGIGLAFQGLLFEPADLVHLGVNTLSLALPLLLVHHTVGKRFDSLKLNNIIKLDAVFYTGVTVMVGFWLAIGEVATPLADWATFAVAYAPLVVLEPLITFSLIRLLQPYSGSAAMKLCTALRAG
ncbi:MAG: energy-coupling factor ABC transporter permease [Azoarcus sp.]|jgi:ABC-type Co2+ transport system permease subunit|nr:energy-coupling factor ABC transporter permease [Azoarcus sp.]MDD2874040.1 energy-coupling factor ABC transporter permease [Azoarcus sp.]MDX9837027.1 energy-coupling factor ABC transporter permease [Azoarcus sp.]